MTDNEKIIVELRADLFDVRKHLKEVQDENERIAMLLLQRVLKEEREAKGVGDE